MNCCTTANKSNINKTQAFQNISPRLHQIFQFSNFTLYIDFAMKSKRVFFYTCFNRCLQNHSNPLIMNTSVLTLPGNFHHRIKRKFFRNEYYLMLTTNYKKKKKTTKRKCKKK